MSNTIKVLVYDNRKFYVSRKDGGKGYCNLSDLKTLIEKGNQINVVKSTGENITLKTLKKILSSSNLDQDKIYNLIKQGTI